MEAERMRAAIGPRADYYLSRFEKIERAGGGWVPGWNLAAFFFSTGWFTYRRMHGWAIANFFLLVGGALATSLAQSLAVFLAWLAVTFVLVPIYANAIYFHRLTSRLAKADVAKSASTANKLRNPPSAWTLVSAVATSALGFVIPVVFVVGPVAYSDYTPRAKVSEGVIIARSMGEEIAAFHTSHRRLPGPQEAAEFRKTMPMTYTESVNYDAERKLIVVTMRDGKRLALHATEKDGTLAWTCRTIDVDRRYLPNSCRD